MALLQDQLRAWLGTTPQQSVAASNQVAITSSPDAESVVDETIYPGAPSAQAIYAKSLLDNPDTNPFDVANAVTFQTPSVPRVDWRAVAGLALQAQQIQREQAAAAQRSWMDTALTAASRVGLPVVGGLVGALGGPVGAAAGAATGGFLGENLAQAYEQGRGLREHVDPVQGLTQGVLSAIPGPALKAGMGVVRQLPRIAGVSTGLGALSSGATQLSETGRIDPTRLALETAIGGAAGTALGSGVVALQNPAVRRALADERGSIDFGPRRVTGQTQQAADTGTGTAIASRPGVVSPADAPDAEWSRIAGTQLPPSARGVLDNVPVPADMRPAGLSPNAPAVTERINRFIERHDAPTEVKDAMRSLLEKGNDVAMQQQRRMGMTWEQMDAEASRILPRIKLPKGSIVSGEELGALRRTAFGLLARADEVATDLKGLDQLEALTLGGGAQAQAAATELSNLYAKYGVDSIGQLKVLEQEAYVEAATAVSSLMGARSEYGRGLNYLKTLQKARATNDADFLAEALKRGAIPEQAIKALRAMPDALARYRYLRALSKPNAQDYWRWYAMTSYLSSAVTQWRNLSGNAANFGVEAVLNVPASAIDAVRNPGNRQVVLSETQAAAAGIASGFLDGLYKARFFFRNGFTMSNAQDMVDIPPEVFGGALVPNLVGRSMGAVDQFFRAVGLHMELHRAATVEAVKEGLQGAALRRRVQELVDDPTITPEIHKRAERYAAGMVYQDTSEGLGLATRLVRKADQATLAAADQAWEAGLNKLGLLGRVTYGAMTFPPSVVIAPFIRTPFNILKRAVQYSPLGAAAAVQAGSRDAMLTAGRSAIGTAMMGLGLGLWLQGRLTGSPPRDPAARDAWYAEGKRPYALRVGDRWITYQHYGQFGVLLGAIANYADETRDDPDASLISFGRMISQAGQAVVENSMLQQWNLAMDAIMSPEANASSEKFVGRIADSMAGFAGLRRDIRAWTDPTIRDPQTVSEHVQANVPGLSNQLQPRVDYTGEEIQRQPAILPSQAQAPDFRQELIRLRLLTGEGYLRDPMSAARGLQTKLNTARKNAGLDQVLIPREVHTEYAKEYGRVAAKVLSSIVATPAYQALPDDAPGKGDSKRRVLEKAKNDVTEALDAQFIARYMQTGTAR